MNKTLLIQLIAQETGLPKSEVKRVIDLYYDLVKGNLKNNNKVTIAGYGTIMPVERKGRPARNLQTGAPILLKNRITVKFKPSPQLIRMLNKPQ